MGREINVGANNTDTTDDPGVLVEKFRGCRIGRFIGKGNAENRPNFEAVESAHGCSGNVCGDRKLKKPYQVDRKLKKPYQVDAVRFPPDPAFVSDYRRVPHGL